MMIENDAALCLANAYKALDDLSRACGLDADTIGETLTQVKPEPKESTYHTGTTWPDIAELLLRAVDWYVNGSTKPTDIIGTHYRFNPRATSDGRLSIIYGTLVDLETGDDVDLSFDTMMTLTTLISYAKDVEDAIIEERNNT